MSEVVGEKMVKVCVEVQSGTARFRVGVQAQRASVGCLAPRWSEIPAYRDQSGVSHRARGLLRLRAIGHGGNGRPRAGPRKGRLRVRSSKKIRERR
jgi:hypothetical protein